MLTINRRLLAERYKDAEYLLQRAQADRNPWALAEARFRLEVLDAMVTAELLAMPHDGP